MDIISDGPTLVLHGAFDVRSTWEARDAIYADPNSPILNFIAVFTGMWGLTKKYKWQLVRGSTIGTAIGIQPIAWARACNAANAGSASSPSAPAPTPPRRRCCTAGRARSSPRSSSTTPSAATTC